MLTPFNNPAVVVQSWYVVALSRHLRPQQVLSRTLRHRGLALYRGTDGQVHAMDSRCQHLGADLGHGSVVGNDLRCPFHHWTYAGDGQCVFIPSLSTVPPGTRTFAYPTAERYGAVWVFNGPTPLFPVPSFAGWRDDELLSVPLKPQVLTCHPHVIACNGLDIEHFSTVHQLTFAAAPVAAAMDEYRMQITLRIRLTGTSLFEKILRRFGGETVTATFTTWGGNLATIDGQLGAYPLLVLFTHRPLLNGTSASQTFLLFPRQAGLSRLLGLQRLIVVVVKLIMGYILRRDRALLDTFNFRANFVHADAPLVAFIEQVNKMPTFEAPQ